MALTDAEQLKIARQYGRKVFEEAFATANLSTADLKAAANDLEAFIVANATALNNALPVPFRTTASTTQKRLLFGLVAVHLSGILDLGGD